MATENGSIRYLGKNRKNPYAVHPPAKLTDNLADYERPKALCYVDDWYVGFAVLNAYHAGTYHAGDELKFKQYRSPDTTELDAFCRRLLTDFSAHAYAITTVQGKTFKEVYELFYERKYGENAPKKLAQKTKSCDIASFKHCEELHDRIFTTITHNELQALINDCQYGTVVKKKIISLLHQMYKYARIYDITDKDNSEGLATSENNSKHGIPFTESDIKVLWKHKDDEMVEMLLIMIYSGFRIAEYETIEVNFDKMYFKGGVKTANSKNRIVPIHSAIQPLVRSRMKKRKKMMNKTVDGFRKKMYRKLEELGIEKHTPHDCRHTFSALCEHFKMPEADRKRLLGHSLGSDITNSVYGHRTLEELRESIEMIKVDVCD